MPDIATLLQQGNSNAWLFIPSAIVLGVLHGLEPGHSKTMMAAFIIAVRGTLMQAVLLGLSATLSHTAVVWAVALAGLYFGEHWSAQATEPYFQIASAFLMMGVAAWMVVRTLRQNHACFHRHAHHHDHDGHTHHHHPHAEDAHARSHAEAIERRFSQRQVTTGQIVMFGLTGGLIPCPASITVLLLCLQLKKFALGATLVLAFSVGLAITMVAAGAVAALSVRHVSHRWSGFGALARYAPYMSGVLIFLVGGYVGYQGVLALNVPA